MTDKNTQSKLNILGKASKLNDKAIKRNIKTDEKLRLQRRKNSELMKQVRKNDATVRLLQELHDIKHNIKATGDAKIIDASPLKRKTDRVEIMLGDIHYSGKRDDARMRKMIKKVVAAAKEHKDEKIRLVMLGDDIEGELHLNSLDKFQEEITVEQVRGIIKHYVSMIKSVVAVVGEKNLEIAFVPESNHGQLRLHGMQRGQQPRNDVGYLILDGMVNHKDTPKVKFLQSKNGVIETADTFYMHGDKGYMNKADKVRLTLGRDKNIVMGHFHSMKVSQHGDVFLLVAPKVTNNHETYAQEAGYAEAGAGFLVVKIKKGKMASWEMVGL